MELRTLEGGIAAVGPSCDDLQHTHKSSSVIWLGALQGPRKKHKEELGVKLLVSTNGALGCPVAPT